MDNAEASVDIPKCMKAEVEVEVHPVRMCIILLCYFANHFE